MHKLTKTLFIIYLLALCWILLLKLGVQFSYAQNRSVNLIPFRTPLMVNGKINALEMILNVAVFAPLGVYAGMLFERWAFRKKLLFFFLVSLTIEALQFVLAIGAFDSTDIITNTAGAVIGLALFKAIESVFNNSVKAHTFISIAAAIATALMILLLFLLKTNRLPIRYQ